MPTTQTVAPTSEKVLDTYPIMDAEEANRIVEACNAAFDRWRTTSHTERAEVLRAIASRLRDEADELAELMTRETGKLLRDGMLEVELCAQIFEYTAQHGPSELADEERSHDGGDKRGVVSYCPIGVIYSIQPWNFPLYQPVRVLAANLMAGNGVVLKHSTVCTGSGLRLRELCIAAGLPEDLFQVLIIEHDLSDDVIAHEKVRGVTLTGSDAAGRHVGQLAAKHLKKTVLELGSNDAFVVLADADLEVAVESCVKGRMFNNAQTCVSAKRFIVCEAVYDAFTDAFVEQMKSIRVGDPRDDDTQLGPLASRDQLDTLTEQVTKSVEAGARVLCGGEPLDRAGYYYPPTVLSECTPGMPAYDDELFGPVASLIHAEDDDDALRLANDSRFGLGGAIFSRDQDRAVELARDRFDTGMVRINSFGAADPNMPFGGVKDSGYGREHGGFGMKEFVNTKAIFLP